MPFAVRTVFIYKLGIEYLGLNSLFSSILQILSLSELGFASAIVFSMYKPIAEDDTDTVCAILLFYRKIYLFIGTIILAAGLLIIPFIPKLIHGTYPEGINIYVIYLIYLMNTVLSYFLFAHKASLLQALQRARYVSLISTIVSLIMYVAQIMALVLFADYYIYAVLFVGGTFFTGILTEALSRKYYPQYVCRGTISKDIRQSIFHNIPGLLSSSLCSASRTTFDSVFVSAYLGLRLNGLYNNYFLIISSVAGFFVMIQAAMGASVGNSIAKEDVAKNYRDFIKYDTCYMYIAGVATVFLACLYQNFMRVWVGSDNILPDGTMFFFCIYFYVNRMGDIRSVYNSSAGLWSEQNVRSIIETVMNLVMNWLLTKWFGLNGIIFGTIFTLFFFGVIWGGYITFRWYFGSENFSKGFLLRQGLMAVSCLLSCSFTYILLRNVRMGWGGIFIRLAACFIIAPFLSWLIFKCFRLSGYLKEVFITVRIGGR